jgi:ABC-type transport system involved in cytochrome bd biosynthesis fused ATPase/permease subunit
LKKKRIDFIANLQNHRGKKLKTHKQQKTTTNRVSVQQPFKTQFLPQKAKSAFKPYMLGVVIYLTIP